MTQQDEPRAPNRRRVGAAFAALRESAGLAQAEAAAHLEIPLDALQRIENGQAVLRQADARALLTRYGVDGAAGRPLIALLHTVNADNWWLPFDDMVDPHFERLLILEDEARRIRVHQPSLVPGLLQTERYAWELMTSVEDQDPETVRRRADLRVLRKKVLDRPGAPVMDVVLEEAALRRRVGDAAVMREQYERLLDLPGGAGSGSGSGAGSTVRIVPFSAGASRASGSAFHIYEADDGPTVVQHELLDHERFTDAPAEVDRYAAAFEHASALALDAGRSREFVAALIRDL